MIRKTFRGAVTVVIAAGLLSACAFPLNAQQFRASARKDSTFYDTAHFVVERPLVDVARTFRRETDPCLHVRISGDVRGEATPYGQLTSREVDTYYPVLQVSVKRVQLTVQMRSDGPSIHNLSAMPKHGYFELVADAVRLGPGKTKVNLYYAYFVPGSLVRAIRGWATGDNVGCPDLAQ